MYEMGHFLLVELHFGTDLVFTGIFSIKSVVLQHNSHEHVSYHKEKFSNHA